MVIRSGTSPDDQAATPREAKYASWTSQIDEEERGRGDSKSASDSPGWVPGDRVPRAPCVPIGAPPQAGATRWETRTRRSRTAEAAPESIDSAATSIPSLKSPARPVTTSAAAALRRTM